MTKKPSPHQHFPELPGVAGVPGAGRLAIPDSLDRSVVVVFLHDMKEVETIYTSIPGGHDLVAWFGSVPVFHDAEIVSLNLSWRGSATLSIHAWNTTKEVDARGHFVLDRHAVVTFTFEDILDLQLDGFSQQNVINGLQLGRAPDRPDRRGFYALNPSPDDYEIELEPCFGLHGLIRCRRVAVSFVPGKPDHARLRPE